MPFDGSLMPCDIIPVPISVSLSSLQEVSSFRLFTNCPWIFIYNYSMTLVCIEHWGLFKISARPFLKRTCTLRHELGSGCSQIFVLSAFPSLWVTIFIFSVFAYNFLQSCIQFTGKKKILSLSFWSEPPDLAPSYWDTWVFPPLNEFHPVEVGGADCVEGML